MKRQTDSTTDTRDVCACCDKIVESAKIHIDLGFGIRLGPFCDAACAYAAFQAHRARVAHVEEGKL